MREVHYNTDVNGIMICIRIIPVLFLILVTFGDSPLPKAS